jgi:hypothetical protein
MNFLKLLAENWDSVLVVLVVIAAIAAIIVKKKWDLLDKILFTLVTWAEREFGGGTGELKLTAAIGKLYPKIPAVIRIFMTQDALVTLVERALTAAKEKWKTNPQLIQKAAK